MAHHPKPFFRSGRGWYVQIGKRQIKLIDGPKCPNTEKAAWEAFHQLMTKPPASLGGGIVVPQHPVLQANASANPSALTIADVFEKYLDWCQRHRSPRTYQWTQNHIQGFCTFLALSAETMTFSQLRPFHLLEWVDSHNRWGPNQRRGALIAVQRPFNWAYRLGYIPDNPVRAVDKPTPTRREQYVSTADFTALLGFYSDGDPFRDLLEFMWETGCRPQEARHVEPRHFNGKFNRFEIPPEEAKGRRRLRVIRLSARALEIVQRRLPGCVGKLFKNEDGKPWTADAVNCRFQRLKRRTGVKHFAYGLRHGFCQRLLENGADHLTVAELMGHSNGQMVAAVYSHMNRADAHLFEALSRASPS